MSKSLYVRAPELCQGADENILIQLGAIIFSGFIDRESGENGLRLCVPGDYRDLELLEVASNKFQILLGALRAWKPIAGERRDEVRPGIGGGSIRDESGNQVVHVGSAIMYMMSGGEIEKYAEEIKLAIDCSQPLKNALWLNGRRDRNSADYYMIYEYAEQEFSGKDNISNKLGISKSEISKLCQSANNLCPTKGGRHAGGATTPRLDLESQRQFVATLLKNWVTHHAENTRTA
jgi:hypothetical protein